MVRTRAIATSSQYTHKVQRYIRERKSGERLTNKRQPDELEPDQGQYGQGDPEQGLGVHGEPEEAAVGGVDDLGAGLAALKDPVAVARGRVDLVPPAQANEAPPRDVLEVVEVGREQEDRDDEDHDQVVDEEHAEQVHEEGGCFLGASLRSARNQP